MAPTGEETTTNDYFTSNKPSKATPKTSQVKKATDSSRNTPVKPPAQNDQRSSPRKKVANNSYTSYKDDDDDYPFLDGVEDAGDDYLVAEAKKNKQSKNDAYMDSDSDKDMPLVQMNTPIRSKVTLKRAKKEAVGMKDDDDDREVSIVRGELRVAPTSSRKRKSVELDEDDSDDLETPKKGVKSKGVAKPPPTKKSRGSAAKDDTPGNPELQAILDSIPIVKAPSPPPKDPDTKFDWRKGGGGNSGPPPAAGAKELPTGEENCLEGLTFVFTGLLETISREEGQELVKRYGGKVTGAPSSKTSYVVLGSDAGPSKLEKIRKMNIKTINEDGLFELVRRLPANGGSSKAAERNIEKKKAQEEKVLHEAAEMEKEEKRRAAQTEQQLQRAAAARGLNAVPVDIKKILPNSQLWTTKYAPTKTNQICGNKGQVEKIQKWLANWPKAHKYGFKLPGPDGSGGYRALIIFGPPGIGKTTAAHLAATLEGYDIIESNASDTRSKKLVESGLSEVLNNSSLLGFFAGDGKNVSEKKKKIVLIMDEVDGMSAGDRGGVGALAKICKKTDVPILLICNERKIPKMKPFDHVAFEVQFRRPTTDQIRSRVATICAREGLKLPPPVMDALIDGSNKDIRQIINMLSTAKLDQSSMDFNQGKSMSKAWEKHIVLKPWDICQKLLGSGMFAPASKATLNDKIELYFNDHERSYLMIQENYLSTKPILANNMAYSPKQQRLKALELADSAAESISDGDLVDRMIHGSQQQWSLMPTHAVFSTVRPASFISGAVTGGGTIFTKWLGNNSKYGKLTRFVKEIQSHMRLRSSGDRHEIRQQYLPVLWTRLIQRLEEEGKNCVDEVIDLMDSYFLTRDDFDYIMELGLGPQEQEKVNLATATKSAFTRT